MIKTQNLAAFSETGFQLISPWHHPSKKVFKLVVNRLTMSYSTVYIFILCPNDLNSQGNILLIGRPSQDGFFKTTADL